MSCPRLKVCLGLKNSPRVELTFEVVLGYMNRSLIRHFSAGSHVMCSFLLVQPVLEPPHGHEAHACSVCLSSACGCVTREGNYR